MVPCRTPGTPLTMIETAPGRNRGAVHQGWNPVVAVFSVPGAGHIVAHLRLGPGPRERWYFFASPTP